MKTISLSKLDKQYVIVKLTSRPGAPGGPTRLMPSSPRSPFSPLKKLWSIFEK